MKDFKEMTDNEFSLAKKKALICDFSPFAQFCFDSKGFTFKSKGGDELFKFQVFERGYINFQDIIGGKTDIVAERKSA